ncbi:MAG TPA: CBS domain-containing protein [Gaiellaceae bacterium]|nr:CBS domain-containing protein [Gaiellaceae bacterium]
MSRIRDLLTVLPRSVKPGDSVVDAAKLMKGEECGIAPVVDEGRLVGVITDRDIAVRVIAEGRDPGTTLVEEIASLDVVTVEPEQDLEEALRLMAVHRVRRLPVVSEDGQLIGIVAQSELLRRAEEIAH